MKANTMLDSKLPNLTKEEKKAITKISNRYLRMKANRVKRKLLNIVKV